MADQPPSELMRRADALNVGLREMSDLLLGGVRTLMAEGGWSEEQARQIVVASYLHGLRQQQNGTTT